MVTDDPNGTQETNGDDIRERLAANVAQRRRTLGLSVTSAAKTAGIDRATWTSLEKGSRDTLDYLFAGIERALQWAPGSIDAIRAGGEPAPIDTDTAAPPTIEDEAIIKVMQSDRIPENQKQRIIAILIEDRERELQRRVALAEDLIRSWEDAG